jgi:site-specific DNA-methyltransferase (adenine-specific)
MSFILYNENCLDVLKRLEDNSVDSVVTDPPYGLSFMGKKWDYDVPSVEIWAECLRVLKPGGHLLAFAGTRTQHRMAVRIEDAGFEIRDMIAWVYGSGFPKSLNVSKALEKNVYVQAHDLQDQPNAAETWQGWGTALKPALEPITVARKPLIGTVAENVLAHGTGAINVDGCRIGIDAQDFTAMQGRSGISTPNKIWGDGIGNVQGWEPTISGRWPANLIHDGSDEVMARFPMSGPPCGTAKKNDSGEGGVTWALKAKAGSNAAYVGDTGSTARFFYCAKASKKDRGENNHPTVKPTDLMRYLCRLVTQPGGVVLDLFMGSGSTGKAAMLEGFQFIGCEMSPEYFEIAKARIEAVKTEPTQKDMFVSPK